MLLGAVNFFVSSINTLVTKTMETTLTTVKQYEAARLEYDAYWTDLEELSLGPPRIQRLVVDWRVPRPLSRPIGTSKRSCGEMWPSSKLKLLEENKVKLMPSCSSSAVQCLPTLLGTRNN